MMTDPDRHRFLGIDVDALTIPNLNRIIEGTIRNGSKCIIANHNLHSVYLCHNDAGMRGLYRQADYVHVDGMSLIYLAQLLGIPLDRKHRVTYVDWIGPLLQKADDHEWRIFYLGARAEVVEAGARRIRRRYSGLNLDYHHGYFDMGPDSEENEHVVTSINDFNPDILMVGMGMPRQEKWIVENRDRVNANVFLPSGACIDYIAGATPTPPRWMGRAGLEWLYRFLQEPGRLWRRIFAEPWPILARFLKEFVRRRLRQTSV